MSDRGKPGKLTGRQRRYLRGLAHGLNAAVAVGQLGVSEAVLREVDEALSTHELIKVKVGRECPLSREEAGARLASDTGCEVAGIIGRVVLLYRARGSNAAIRLPVAVQPGKGAPVRQPESPGLDSSVVRKEPPWPTTNA